MSDMTPEAKQEMISKAIIEKALNDSISVIDTKFNPGYAMKNPALLSTMVNSYISTFLAIAK